MSASKITQLMQSESFEEKFRKSWLEEKLDGLTLHVGIDRRYQRLGKEETDKVSASDLYLYLCSCRVFIVINFCLRWSKLLWKTVHGK